MPTIRELIEMKRKELRETAVSFVSRFPGSTLNNAAIYSRFKSGSQPTIPKAWLPVLSELLEMSSEEILNQDQHDKEKVEEEAIKKERSETSARGRMIVSLTQKFKNRMAARLVLTLFRVNECGFPLEGHRYTYDDPDFHDLVYAVLTELNIELSDESRKEELAREVIGSIATNDEDKLLLATAVFPVFGYVYSSEEMPKLRKQCGRFF